MQLEQLRPFLSSSVFDLARASGAKFVSFAEWMRLEGNSSTTDFIKMTFVAGWYSSKLDVIVIQPHHCAPQGYTVDEVLLHELVHWTGAKHRLRRKVMVLGSNPRLAGKLITKPKEVKAFEKVLQTEELIAHAGMFELSAHLGLDMGHAERSLNRYVSFQPFGDKNKAADEALRAARYLLMLNERPSTLVEFLQSHIFMK